MPLIIRGGKLLIGSGGNLTTNNDCCCDPEPGICECTDDDNNVISWPSLQIDVTGSTTPLPTSPGGCPAPSSCPDITGSYVMDCPDDLFHDSYVFVCQNFNNTVDFYYYLRIGVLWPGGGGINVEFRTGVASVPAGGTPDPTSHGVPTQIKTIGFTVNESDGTVDPCPESYTSPVETTTPATITTNGCRLNGLSASVTVL